MNVLHALSLRTKLLLLLALSTLAIVVSIGAGAIVLQDRMVAERIDKLSAVVHSTTSVAQSLQTQVVAGKLTREQALAHLAEFVHGLRFDDGAGYVSVQRGGVLVIHGSQPSREGKMSDAKASDGRTIADLVATLLATSTEGVIRYDFPKPGHTEPQLKLSYVAKFAPWDLEVLAGAYIDDIETDFRRSVLELAGLGGCILAVTILLTWLINRDLGAALGRLKHAMERLARQDLAVDVPGTARGDEFGRMADSVQLLKDALLEKQRLEHAAAVARAQADAERKQMEAERARAAAEQTDVVAQLGAGLSRLSEGDLGVRIEHPFAPDYDQLRQDFNTALGAMQTAIAAIASSTDTLRSGSGEITQATDDLARRTEQQAASLEQTAAALSEIMTTVRRTADGAKLARESVATARTDADRSGEVVRNAVSAMGEIEASAQHISQIIGVIDEIAFQTNLLALNAGVEAARAGDAGRGFAVVASEVRALAQRSADAAREIKGLISTSTKQVGRGVELVDEAGRALARIVAQVGAINEAVADIAASAQEQANGLGEVNTAVIQMDQVTQQNAAMVEQTTAASHSLMQETARLVQLTTRFRTDAEAPAPANTQPGPSLSNTPPRRAPARATALALATRAQEWEEF